MAIVAVFQGPTLTRENYEESVRRLTGGRARLETPADWPVEGLLVHVAGEGPTASGWWMCGSPRKPSVASAST
jgi:hypothetical protein